MLPESVRSELESMVTDASEAVMPLTIPVEPSMRRCAPLLTVNDTGALDHAAGLLPPLPPGVEDGQQKLKSKLPAQQLASPVGPCYTSQHRPAV